MSILFLSFILTVYQASDETVDGITLVTAMGLLRNQSLISELDMTKEQLKAIEKF